MLPSLKQIRREELGGDAPDWVDRLLWVVNSFFASVYNMLNGKLALVENVRAELTTLTELAPFEGRRFKTKIAQTQGILLMGITGIGAGAVFTDSVVLRARQDGMEIVVDSLSGLTSGQKYTVKFLVL